MGTVHLDAGTPGKPGPREARMRATIQPVRVHVPPDQNDLFRPNSEFGSRPRGSPTLPKHTPKTPKPVPGASARSSVSGPLESVSALEAEPRYLTPRGLAVRDGVLHSRFAQNTYGIERPQSRGSVGCPGIELATLHDVTTRGGDLIVRVSLRVLKHMQRR